MYNLRECRFVALVALMFVTLPLIAGPADPAAKRVTLSDGTEATVFIRGDEHAHAITDVDGMVLRHDRERGVLTRTAELFPSAAQRKILDYDYPTTGSPKALVVLMAFSDKAFESVSDPQSFYDDLLNKEGFTYSNGATGSAYDYYNTASAGAFTPQFVVAGPVTLSNTQTYYGYDDDSGNEIYVSEGIIEACTLLDDEIDFSDYDLDGDGYVDNIFFWYAGGGQADDPYGTDYIWPHAATLEGTWGDTLILDGVHISRYACTNEVRYSDDGAVEPSGLGNFIHEFSHVLGLQDHYDVYYGSNTFDPDSWDVMATGAYNNNMHTPPTFSAFERAEVGWLEYTTLTSDADSVTQVPSLTTLNTAYRVPIAGCGSSRSADGDEFYVIENRQQEGWDAYLPGHGMIVWHIDADSARWATNRINTLAHQYVDLVEADGIQSDETRAGDAFPGTASITTYSLLSWEKDTVAVIDDVAEVDGEIRLLLGGTAFLLPPPSAVTIMDIEDSSFVVTIADAEEMAASYPNITYTYYVYNVDELVATATTAQASYAVEGLAPATTYITRVRANLGSYTSEVTEVTATTLELTFEKRKPSGLEAATITSTSFTATWEEVEDAEDYLTTLYAHSYGDAATQGYDFTDKATGMPELWESSSATFYSVSGYYGATSPSLRLSSDGDYLVVAFADADISAVTFWARSNKDGNSIIVEGYADGEWGAVETIDISTTAATYEAVCAEPCSALRMTFDRSSGYVVIDDVTATTLPIVRTAVEGYDAVSTGGATAYPFEGLSEGSTYGFTITATQGALRSYPSDECVVKLPVAAAIKEISNDVSNSVTAIYDLQGRRIDNSSNNAIVIIRYDDGRVVKQVRHCKLPH